MKAKPLTNGSPLLLSFMLEVGTEGRLRRVFWARSARVWSALGRIRIASALCGSSISISSSISLGIPPKRVVKLFQNDVDPGFCVLNSRYATTAMRAAGYCFASCCTGFSTFFTWLVVCLFFALMVILQLKNIPPKICVMCLMDTLFNLIFACEGSIPRHDLLAIIKSWSSLPASSSGIKRVKIIHLNCSQISSPQWLQ